MQKSQKFKMLSMGSKHGIFEILTNMKSVKISKFAFLQTSATYFTDIRNCYKRQNNIFSKRSNIFEYNKYNVVNNIITNIYLY
jgi:hypothetical protein